MRTLGEAADFVVKRLAEIGFDKFHRFAKMRQALGGPGQVIEPDDSRFAAAREAIRDMRLMEFCLDRLCGAVDEVALRKKLGTAIGDPVSPTEIPKRSAAGRNAQAELFVAAICQAAAMTPRFVEPDLVVCVGDADHAIAVKRPCTGPALAKRIQEGIEQIRRSNLPGVVVVDATLLCNRGNQELRATSRWLRWMKRPLTGSGPRRAATLANGKPRCAVSSLSRLCFRFTFCTIVPAQTGG